MKSDYELAREARIEANKRKISELRIEEAWAELKPPTPVKAPRQKRQKAEPTSPVEVRRSERARTTVNYCEDVKVERVAGPPRDNTHRIDAVRLDEETAEKLRAEAEARRTAALNAKGKSRGPIDSGKGVRIQGGKVYDSTLGVTCHWCRQKTLEDHVTCSNSNCGGGRRMPLSFCKKCLQNRHGEDADAAQASGKWMCPPCRGSCGPGCVCCCNCGPCRKKAGLDPTHQIVKLARDAGFSNVHDYLVHLVTGEAQERIQERKAGFAWGAWTKSDSEASEQTHNSDGGAASGDDAADGEAPPAAEPPSMPARQQQGGRPARGKRATAAAAAATAPSSAAVAAAAAAVPKRKGRAARGAAQVEALACPPSAPASEDGDTEGEAVEEAVELPSSQTEGGKANRKQRMLQRMGLAPVEAAP